MNAGKIVGGLVMVGATAAIWMWPDAKVADKVPEPVRPVRSVVVTDGVTMPDLKFAGVVKANESRTLCFKQPGRIERIPVAKGERVKKGEKLAWLVKADFVQELERAKAAAERDRLTFARKSEAAKKNAISQEDVSQAAAQLRQSEAALALAEQALADTVLVAPFDAVVADVPATELDMVGSQSPVVMIQDMSKVKIDVPVPEAYVITARQIRYKDGDDCQLGVRFDSAPEKAYPARFVEYAGAANAKTQTFLATYVMDPPEDLLLLPGMSATVMLPGSAYEWSDVADGKQVEIPNSAVGVDASGGTFVWVLEKSEENGVYVAKRRAVKKGCLRGESVCISEGLAAGERIATAGVAVLAEGRRVTLLENAK